MIKLVRLPLYENIIVHKGIIYDVKTYESWDVGFETIITSNMSINICTHNGESKGKNEHFEILENIEDYIW